MAKIKLDDDAVKGLAAPAAGNRIDYDIPKGPRDTGFVRGFAVRTTAAGLKTFLLVYVTATGRERRQKIGDYGPHTVTTARDAARKLRIVVDAGGDPFAGQKEARAEAEAKRALSGATLGGLLTAYVEQLRRGKKPSAHKVEAEIHRTIKWKLEKTKGGKHKADEKKKVTKLWNTPAADVTLDDLTEVTGQLVKDEKWRQAEKTRSYLRAAYTAAVASRGNAATRDLYAGLSHIPNTARDLATIPRPETDDDGQVPTGKRALSLAELGAYWQRIKVMPGPHGALLRFHLLTGAQRCEQLARLTTRGYDRDAGTVTLMDGKGRRKRIREHVVPLLPDAVAALAIMTGDAGPFLFTLDGGEHGACYHTTREQVGKVAAAMVKAGEAAEPFTPGELRITVETRLAAAGVDKETRGFLQSHGLGGVQNAHYNKHTYLDEKREALETLRRLLEPRGKVVPIRRRSA